MPNPIKPKRSYTPNSVPTTGDLQAHEMAINWNDGKIFTKDGGGSIVTLTLGGSGGSGGISWVTAPTLPTSSGTAGQVAYDSGYYYICTASNTWRRVAIAAWSEDAYAAYVQLLVHGDSDFSDSSTSARTLTASGATISTSTKKYGAGSMSINGGGQYVSLSGASAFNMAGDFVIEFWVNLSSASSQQWFLGGPTNGSSYLMGAFNVNASGQLWLGQAGVAWPVQFSGLSLSNSTWHYIAISRSGSTNRCYVDGTLASSVTDSTSWTANPTTIWLGSQSGGTSMTGFLDDFRWTVGSNRGYTGSTITVPTAAFPNP